MTVYIQLLSCESVDSSPCVCVVTENFRFLFNVGEGTQRLCVEHKVRIGKVEGVFITKCTPKSMAGLPGFALTAADAGKTCLNVFGPVGIKQYWNAVDIFVRRSSLHMNMMEVIPESETKPFVSTDLEVKPIVMRLSEDNIYSSYICKTPTLPGKFDILKAQALSIPKGPMYGKLKSNISITLDSGEIIEPYQVVGQPEQGKHFSIICCFDDVDINEDSGKVLYHDTFKFYQLNETNQRKYEMICMIHLSSLSINSNTTYKAWMNSFGSNTQHIFLGQNFTSSSMSSFLASTLYTQKLCFLSPNLFTNLSYLQSYSYSSVGNRLKSSEQHSNLQNVIVGYPLMKYYIQTPKGTSILDYDLYLSTNMIRDQLNIFQEGLKISLPKIISQMKTIRSLFKSDYLDTNKNLNTIINTSSNSNSDQISREELQSLCLEDMRSKNLIDQSDNAVWFLGTACAIPSKYRNVSGIMIEIASTNSYVLLEAGESTWYQLIRMHYHRKVDNNTSNWSILDTKIEVSRKLKLIWISHPHADHHLGLVSIIEERWKILEQEQKQKQEEEEDQNQESNASATSGIKLSPVIVIAPESVITFLNEYSILNPSFIHTYIALSNRYFDPQDHLYSIVILNSFENKNKENMVIEDKTKEKNDVISSFNTLSSLVDNYDQNNSSYQSHERCQLSQKDIESYQSITSQLSDIGIESIVNVRVIHCLHAYGVSITLSSNLPSSIQEGKRKSMKNESIKIVYSGDTRPCLDLIQIGHEASILIHEGTFEDILEDDAISKRHSTISEAISVSNSMNAYRLVLTHFSQRYQSLPTLPTTTLVNNKCNMILAFDFMRISFKDMVFAPLITKVLREVFPPEKEHDDEEMDEIGIHEEKGQVRGHEESATTTMAQLSYSAIDTSNHKKLRHEY